MAATPTERHIQPAAAVPMTKQPISWADMDSDDDSADFNMPVMTLRGQATPSTDRSGRSDQGTPSRPKAADQKPSTVAKAVHFSEAGAKVNGEHTVAKKVAKKIVPKTCEELNPSRALLPSFCEVQVDDNVIPYQLKTSVKDSSRGTSPTMDCVPAPSPSRVTADSFQMPSASASVASTQPQETRTIHPDLVVEDGLKGKRNARRLRALRTLADCLLTNQGPMSSFELNKQTSWNRRFRPSLGCLFNFIKSYPTYFKYEKGDVSLTFEADIVSSLLISWQA